MVEVNLDIIAFLQFGKIGKYQPLEKNHQFLLKHFFKPDQIEEYSDSNFVYYHYNSIRFLISDRDIIESISIDGSFVKEYNVLSKLIGLLILKKIPFVFDKKRTDKDYLFIRIDKKGQVIIDIEEDKIFRFNYPYL